MQRSQHERERGGGGREEAEPSPPEPAAPATPQQAMLRLQQGAGNAAAARAAAGGGGALLQRDFIEDIGNSVRRGLGTAGHNFAQNTGLETAEEAEAGRAATFHDTGPYHGEVTPGGAGVGGGFEAIYDPAAGEMKIAMRCAVDFVDALTLNADGTISPHEPKLQGLATHAAALTGADRTSFIAQYQWQASEHSGWKSSLETLIESAWSSDTTRHEFHVARPGWDWIGARIKVDLDVHDAPKAGTDHILIETVKFPEGENMYSFAGGSGDFSRTAEGTHDTAHDQSMVVASTDLGARPDDNVLQKSVFFERNKSKLTPAAKSFLDDWIKTFEGANDPRSINQYITLIGHTSSSGSDEYNMELADKRIEAVRGYLESKAFHNLDSRVMSTNTGKAGASEGEIDYDRRVDIIVGRGDAQVLAVHEFGHAFGLDDEYADTPLYGGSGAAVGDPVTHDDATKAITAGGSALPGAIHENTDSIMSAGNVIRPQHYSTFHKALREITGIEEWALGGPGPRSRP